MDLPESICSITFHYTASSSALQVGCAFSSPKRKENLEDVKSHKLTLFQFDDNAADLSNLETLLVRFSPVSQLLLPAPTAAASASNLKERQLYEKLRVIAQTASPAGVELIECKRPSKAAEEDSLHLLEQALGGESELLPHKQRLLQAEWKLARTACNALLSWSHAALASEQRFAIEFDSLSHFMRLDASTTRALNLFPDPSGEANKESSLFGVLNRTVTKRMGARLLHRWIKYPLCDALEIAKRQTRVESLVMDTEQREALRALLRSAPDLDAISHRLQSPKASSSLDDLYVVYLFCQKLPELSEALAQLGVFGEEAARLDALSGTGKFAQYVAFVESVLDLDLAPREFIVRSEHDESGELARLLQERQTLDAQLARKRDEAREDAPLCELEPKWETDLKMIKTHGHHFRVPKKYDAVLSKIKHGRTLLVVTAGIRWTTEEIAELSEQRQSVSAQYMAAQSEFVREAMQVAQSYACLIDLLAQLLAELDCYASLAHVASTCPVGEYTKPLVCDAATGQRLFVPNARHAMLELQQDVCDSFVPNTHEMDRASSRVQILTGPNMSGKSTFARELGVLCVMAQIGSYLPCSAGAEMPIVDAILARVGASDSQLTGVSTFMAEMNETSSILSTVTDQSLVIIDELGRGTSTYDGFGLAWAICEHLAQRTRAFVIFATHFQELTALGGNDGEGREQGIVNLHVDALVQEDKIVMLHKVKPGRSQHSFGVNIAQMAGFPQDVVRNAQEKLRELDMFKGFVGEGDKDSAAVAEAENKSKRLKMLAALADEHPADNDLLESVKRALGSGGGN